MRKKAKVKIGLALGSGGAKGLAHIGVIKALVQNDIPIDFIAGSSVGALIGGLYAVFEDSQKLEEIVLSTSWRQLFSMIDPSLKGGLIKGKKIKFFLEKIIGKVTFDDLEIPFKAVATDFKTGETVEISRGEVSLAIQASGTLPFVFEPVSWEGKLLSDGGISNPVPVNTVRNMGADIVVAVNLENKSHFMIPFNQKNPYSIIQRAVRLLVYHLAQDCIKSADIVIEPNTGDLGLVSWTKFFDRRGENIISIGEEATQTILPKVKNLIQSKNNSIC
jgi:NTE family protein